MTGLKPTYGRVSRYGLVAFASSLDQIGPLARTAEDAALLLEVIAGHDPLDSTSIPQPVPRYTETVRQPLEGLAAGSGARAFWPGLGRRSRSCRARGDRQSIESLGAKIVELSMPHGKYGVATYYIIAPCEASSNLARYDGVHYGYRTDEAAMNAELAAERRALIAAGKHAEAEELDNPLVRMYRRSRAEGFGPEVKRRIMLGTYALSAGYYDAYYLKALKVRRLIRQDYDEAFKQVDLIVGPVTATPAFKIGEKSDDPLAMYLVDLVHGDGEPGRHRRHRLPLRLQLRQPADRLATASPAVRGRPPAPRRPHVPTGHRLAQAAPAAAEDEENRRWTPMNADVRRLI